MAKPAATFGPTRLQLGVRSALVAGYIGIVALGLTTDVQPRIFWTMLLPLLPISIVLMGFANWRQICPLALFGEIGRKLNRGTQRRVPKWLERWFFVVTFTGLLAMLVFRLVATNGDGVWLSWLLVALALTALVANLIFTGKTWCNFFCPIGFVERIYTEPRSLPTTPNSQCDRCTACKSSCPDIDPENGYWRDLPTTGRRIATYAFPGLVLAFYTYYWLRHGDWEAYFDGRWTRIPADADLAFGAGLFFAPALPALAAATLTLVIFSAASYLLFVLIEIVAGRFVKDPERRRHLILAVAAFAAFSIFYIFAGAPTLRGIPGATRVMAFTAPLLATLFLVKRWARTRESFIREKGAVKLLRAWPFDEAPPDDASEVYGWVKGSERAREQNVAAYANIVREMIADGLVRKGELRLLEGVRTQLGITEREHDKVLARLTEEERDLFEREDDAGIEERAQLEGYEAALAQALLRHASEHEISELRQAFGVSREIHAGLLERMRGESGVLLARARDHLGRVRARRADLEVLATPEPNDAETFLSYLLLREQDEAIQRVVDLLEIVGRSEEVKTLRSRLFAGDASTRRAAVQALGESCPGALDLLREMEPWIVGRTPVASRRDPGAWAQLLERCAFSSDLYIRAAAIWAAGGSDEPWARSIVAGAEKDTDPLVRDTALHVRTRGVVTFAPGTRFGELSTIEKMQFLRSVPLFGCLEPEDLHDVVGFVGEETVTPPTVLCKEGEVDAGDLFIILEGRASVVVRSRASDEPDGEREVTVFDAGEIVGEISMLDGSPRSATVRPKDGPIRVLRISGQRFRSRLLPRSRVARPLLVTLAQRIRHMSQRAADE
jgi:CRP-like cAMP-binding protein